MRWLLLLALTACDASVERLPLASECADDARDMMDVTIDGHRLCARAGMIAAKERSSGSEGIILPDSFSVTVTSSLMANDGITYYLAVGFGQRTELSGDRMSGGIDPTPPRRSDFSDIYSGAFASLHLTPTLDLHYQDWATTKGGSVVFDHYDLNTGTSRGRFDVVFEVRTSMIDTKRIAHATGSFATASPIVDYDEIISSSADTP